MISSLTSLAALAILAVFVVAFLSTYSRTSELLTIAVGVSAATFELRLGPFHVFSAMVAVWALHRCLLGRRTSSVGLPLMLLFSAALMASSVLLGDLVNSPTLALQLLTLAAGAVLVALWVDSRDSLLMLRGLLAGISLSSVVGLAQVVGIIPIALWHPDVSAIGRPIGLYPEPDWLGLFAGVGTILAWRIVARPRLRTILVLLNLAALVLAFARAAWIGVLAAVVLYGLHSLVSGRSREAGRKTVALVATIALAGAITLALVPALRADLSTRLGETVSVSDNDISGQARLQQTEGLLQLASDSPWYGRGLSASGRVGVSGRLNFDQSENNVGSNWVLSAWVDSRYLAIPFIVMLGAITLLAGRSPAGQALAAALASSLFSNATYFPLIWILLGLAMADLSRPRRFGSLTRSQPSSVGRPSTAPDTPWETRGKRRTYS